MKEEEFDIFVNNTIYPSAEVIFQSSIITIEAIKDECIFVLDTNALLVPYLTGSHSLAEIKKVFSILTEQKRLIVPGQVAREFATNRPTKIKEIFQQLNRKQNDAKPIDTGHYPLLEDLEDYQAAIKLEKELNIKLKEYRKTITKILARIKLWNWDDPVSNLYRQLFKKEAILDIIFDRKEIEKQLKYRYKHKIPPGFKDGGKEDDGIGDYLIWLTILELASQKKHVVFISGDVKTDWYHISEGQPLYPRFELLAEFQSKSDNKSFHILRLSELLKLLGVDETVVEEIAIEEKTIVSSFRKGRIFQVNAERAVYYWYQNRCSKVTQIDNGAVDFEAIYDDGLKVGVEVILVNEDLPAFYFAQKIKDRFYKAYFALQQKTYDKLEFVVVAHGQNYDINELLHAFDAILLGFDKNEISIMLGYLHDKMESFIVTVENYKFD